MDLKILFVLLSFLVNGAAFVFYLKGIFKGTTQPHAYTWLIWTLTLGITTAGVWYGGGGYQAIVLGLLTIGTFFVFFLSFKFGTANITVGDTCALIVALLAIAIWVFLENPLLSILIATGIDAVGYWPSIRKSFIDPWSETLDAWVLWTAGTVFSILALASYNVLTLSYYVMGIAANILVLTVLLARRRVVPKS